MFSLANNNGLRNCLCDCSTNHFLLNWFTTFVLTHCYRAIAMVEKERDVNADDDSMQNYNVEDFLWMDTDYDSNVKSDSTETAMATSGMSPVHHTTITVFHTTTIMSTATIIYNFPNASSILSEIPKCSGEICTIIPTPVLTTQPSSQSPHNSSIAADLDGSSSRYWLITVLKTNVSTAAQPLPLSELEQRLAKLYRTAFNRQQAFHLGLYNNRSNSSRRSSHLLKPSSEVASVVRARRAHHRDAVTVTIYNVSSSSSLSSSQILYTVRVSGHPVSATAAAHDMRFISDLEITNELGYPVLIKARPYLEAETEPSITLDKVHEDKIFFYVSSSIGIVLLFVLVSIVILLLLNRFQLCRKKTMDTNDQFEDDEATDQRRVVTASRTDSRNRPLEDNNNSNKPNARQRTTKFSTVRNVSSSNSYLSMPSVKQFPSASLPEPLANMLPSCGSPNGEITAHAGSLQVVGECSGRSVNDPGVISPAYRHFHKDDSTDDDDDDDCVNHSGGVQINCDDNFKMCDPYTETKSHKSFHDNRHLGYGASEKRAVERTVVKPRNVWDKGEQTVTRTTITHQLRPVSAGHFQRPIVHPEFILTDAHLAPSDPAITVITAIKQELDKVSSKTTVIPKPD